jgi:hypothetical protein
LGGYNLPQLPKNLPGVLDCLEAIGIPAKKIAEWVREGVAKLLKKIESTKPTAEIIEIPETPSNEPKKPATLCNAA